MSIKICWISHYGILTRVFASYNKEHHLIVDFTTRKYSSVYNCVLHTVKYICHPIEEWPGTNAGNAGAGVENPS